MFDTVINQLNGYFERRFILTFLFPSLFFWGAIFAVGTSASGLGATFTSWEAQNATEKLAQVVLAVSWIVFFAFLIKSQLPGLTRQFLGYWNWVPFGLGTKIQAARQKHYKQILEKSDYERIYYEFPLPSQGEYIMATRLGNIFKNAELYSHQRYHIDAVLLWPRLYAVLPESFIKSFSVVKSSLDLMLVVATLSSAFAVISLVSLATTGGSTQLMLICFFGGMCLAWLAYRSALSWAVTYGQLLKSAFDLYKNDLLKKMGYERPQTLAAEIDLWNNLCKLIYRAAPDDNYQLPYGS